AFRSIRYSSTKRRCFGVTDPAPPVGGSRPSGRVSGENSFSPLTLPDGGFLTRVDDGGSEAGTGVGPPAVPGGERPPAAAVARRAERLRRVAAVVVTLGAIGSVGFGAVQGTGQAGRQAVGEALGQCLAPRAIGQPPQ